MIPSVNLIDDESYAKFWKSFIAWFESEDHVNKGLKEEYKYYDNWNGGTNFINIDYSKEFKIKYGIDVSADYIKNNSDVDLVSKFIELAYDKWVDNRYEFTINVNKKFEEFKLPQKLKKGNIYSNRSVATIKSEVILNKEMFENKLLYSRNIINSRVTLDKKTALDLVIDCLQYLISIQFSKNVSDKYKDIGLKIGLTKDSKVYAVINTELNEVMKMANEYFDIRHNEHFNKSNEVREPLINDRFIDYLYDRCYGLVNLILTYEIEEIPVSEIKDKIR